MATDVLSSRAIIGEFYDRLGQTAAPWVDQLTMYFKSDQESETYKWLGMVPQLREFIEGRNVKGLRDEGITIKNKVYEATLSVPVDDLRRDKTGQILVRVAELADQANRHNASLLSSLILAGESALCYDGQYYFDTDHITGDSGQQSNDLTNNIGTPSAPTAAEMESGIMNAIETMLGFKDDQGEPLNEGALNFSVMVPNNMWGAAVAATKNPVIVDGSASRTALLPNLNGFSITVAANTRLTNNDRFYVFRNDGIVKPFIRQEELPASIMALAEGSEEEFKNRRHLYTVEAIRGMGYGYWQHACLVTNT